MKPLRNYLLAAALATLATVLITTAMTGHAFYRDLFRDRFSLAITVGTVLLTAAVLALLTTLDRGRSTAVIRLDWFLPALRRVTAGNSPSHTFPGRLLRRWIPARFQSDRLKKKRGWIRKSLRKLGVSWLATPVRRVVQSVCLVTFVLLFFYVCWPYSARPLPPGGVSHGWSLQSVDQQSGEFVLTQETSHSASPSDWEIKSGAKLFVVDDRVAAQATAAESITAIGPFVVTGREGKQIRLTPRETATPAMLDAFLSGSGAFQLAQRDPQAWPSHYADNLSSKEFIPAESFLLIDPLVSLSTAVASRSWIASLVSAAAILIVCILIPRGFCGYLCPLGTTIDLFDWAIARRTTRFNVPDDGWWVHIKYYLLAGTLIAAVFGVLVSGFVSAIPVITRAMLFIGDPLHSGVTRGWHLVPSIGVGHFVSIGLFIAVLSLGFLRPRFWCKYVCPSGAVFSLGNLFRVTERKVESSCIHCNKCVEICPFDAIKPDFTTRTSDCTMCQSCGGVCPTHAIKFVERWNVVELKVDNDPPTNETPLGRRGFLSLAAGSTAAAVGGIGLASVTKAWGANLDDPNSPRLVRPPGSVPEQSFLEMCIRCGECFKACPNNVLQPEGFQQGLEGLWTPMVVADWAGCESSCNACGHVCPTGAIRPLVIEEKKAARMGLAIVDESTCLPFAGTGACDLCVQECDAAGYHAIEFTQVGTELDEAGQPVEGTGYLAPVVLDDKCVGCGLCQTRCYAINVKAEGLLSRSAIIIEAGEGKEDRLHEGSYIALREQPQRRPPVPTDNEVVPPAEPIQPKEVDSGGESADDPFGVQSDEADADPFGLSD
ncbi:4Fe-4S binding protein [Novipirellula caenicola]|uniref:Ferredoxin-type protein NapF n=1 Tax=Novipirellula caenicola TaxID=1536901 RepID=A0ABP9VUF8_9BACT